MARMMGQDMETFGEEAYRQGVGVYPSVARAARTVAQMLEWKSLRIGLPEIFS